MGWSPELLLRKDFKLLMSQVKWNRLGNKMIREGAIPIHSVAHSMNVDRRRSSSINGTA